jgi:hypothetical protein
MENGERRMETGKWRIENKTKAVPAKGGFFLKQVSNYLFKRCLPF